MRKYQYNIRREPIWRHVSRVSRDEVPAALVSWLIDTASLTRRLQERCGAGFRVELLEQRWRRPLLSERHLLGLEDSAYALVRQVRLWCARQPLVYARTVMPAATLKGARRRFARLGNRPLGAMLFSDHRIERGDMELARIDSGQMLHGVATENGRFGRDGIWGRRSVFRIEGYPLLVSEIFLPGIVRDTLRGQARR